MKCNKCNELVDITMLFCPNCGNKIEGLEEAEEVKVSEETVISEEVKVSEETIILEGNKVSEEVKALDKRLLCPRCSAEYDKEDVFCPNCGYNLAALEPVVLEEKEIQQTTDKKTDKASKKEAKKAPNKKKGVLKIIGIILAVVVLTAAVVIIATIVPNYFGSKKGGVGELIYYKDNSLMKLNGSKSIEISDRVFKDEDDESSVGDIVCFTKDGSRIIYPQKYEDNSFNLYVRSANSKENGGAKIDSGVISYKLAGNNKVVYEKGDKENALYVADFDGNREKIIDESCFYYVSEDGKKLLYTTFNNDGTNDLYILDLNLKDSPLKIASKIDRLVTMSKDFEDIYYLKKGSLYECLNFSDSEKIISHVEEVITKKVDDVISLYIIVDKENQRSIPYENLFKDPKVSPNYETESLLNEYLTDYSEKELYYYSKNTKDMLLAQGYVSYNAGNNEAFTYCVFNGKAEEKLSINKLNDMSYDEKVAAINLFKSKNSTFRINVGGYDKTISASLDDFAWDDSCTSWYDKSSNTAFLSFVDKEKKLLLTKVDLNGDAAVELVSDDFDHQAVAFDGNIFYLVNKDEDGAELYANGKLIDSDVNYVYRAKDEQTVLYMKDHSEDGDTIMVWQNGKTLKVSDDVYHVYTSENGDIALLTDYDYEEKEGDLKLYHNGKLKKIDSGVGYIVWFR